MEIPRKDELKLRWDHPTITAEVLEAEASNGSRKPAQYEEKSRPNSFILLLEDASLNRKTSQSSPQLEIDGIQV